MQKFSRVLRPAITMLLLTSTRSTRDAFILSVFAWSATLPKLKT
jgi:hypothetical protein